MTDSFYQYFANSSGDNAHFAPAAIKAIGATNAAAICENANSVFPDGDPARDESARQTQPESLDSSVEGILEKFDLAFCAYPDNLTKLLFEYVAKNQAAIAGSVLSEEE